MTATHKEHVVAPGRRLGRRKPDPAKPALKLGNYLTGVVPEHPVAVDYLKLIADWGLYGNDNFGDCGPTDIGNSRKLVSLALGGHEVSPTQDDVFDLYRRSGNPGFDPATDADDNGVEMQTMLGEVVKGGIGGMKALGFAKVDVTNLDEVRAAIAVFGWLHLGIDLDVAQQQQTDNGGPWDYKRSGAWGGHAVGAGTFTSSTAAKSTDISVVTWGEVIGTTDTFWAHQVEEAWVVIWPEHLGSKQFLAGVDLAALADDYKQLTGRDFPATIPPAPAPAPTPDPGPAPSDIDGDFAAALERWLAGGPWFYKSVQKAAAAWLKAKEL